MNFLAHILLSGEDDFVKIGNFIGDYVKGKQYTVYPPQVQKGILMHRNIDDFTDKSSLPKQIKPLFSHHYRKYAGIVIDLFYDHFLAVNWLKFSEQSLSMFVREFYAILQQNKNLLPERVQNFLPRMIAQNRLYSYLYFQGLEQALTIMSKHTSLPDHTQAALDILSKNYQAINQNFLEFFPELIGHIEILYPSDLQERTE